MRSFYRYCGVPVPGITLLLTVLSYSTATGIVDATLRSASEGDTVLIHHWNFNDIPNDFVFSPTDPELLDLSSRLYGAFLSYDGALWDRVNDPTPLNAREDPYILEDDRALRLRNPAGALTIELPTTGYRDVVLRYAITRTSNGARTQQIAYSLDGGETYQTEGLTETAVSVNEDEYKLVELDFSGIEGADNNPDFQVRLTMSGIGSEPENEDGNQRINHVTLEGMVAPDEFSHDLIHHWKFDNIPNIDGSFPTRVEISAGGITGGESMIDGAWIRYDGDYWDRVNAPTPFNARAIPYDEEDDRALRLRNPTGDFTLRLPTTGYRDIVFRYVVKRTGNGAVGQEIAYSTDGNIFVTDELRFSTVQVGERYVLHELNFYGIDAVNDNPEFTIRITGSGVGSEPENREGNQRFNHITVDARSLDALTGENPEQLPDRIRLDPNFPNPFNPDTQIRFALPEEGHVTLEIFDITGQKITTLIDRTMLGGEHVTVFNADGLSSGIYLCRLQVGDQQFLRRMTLLK